MAVTDISIIYHIAVLLLFLWALNSFNHGHPVFYVLSFVYLYMVHQRYIMRLTRKLQHEERRRANQRRMLLDSETVRWLNHAVAKIWPLCLEDIVSQKLFLPIIPWFLEKYKPWTVKRAAIQHLYLGRNPPMFTEMRVLQESSDDDHLVLELGINFLTADDMSAILAAKLRKRVGLGIVAKMHMTSLHVEGKVLVGVKFMSKWPYIDRLRICFAQPPYFQMTVKPLFNHGVDVTELPGVAGWLDNLLAVAFEQTLVEPNMLVVDMEKFVSPQKENWFSMLVKEPIAYAKVEVIEALNMKPSDLNGMSDPYVKGQLGPYKFKTRIQKNTLDPKWYEEFKIPLCCWESDSVMTIEVCDKDTIVDDRLGVCSIDLSNLRDGKRHDMWVSLEDVKVGRLHLAITVIQTNSKETDRKTKDKKLHTEDNVDPLQTRKSEKGSSRSGKLKQSEDITDTFEAVDFQGQQETGIWVHRPGSDVPHVWEPRKGKTRHILDTEIQREGDASVSTPKSSSRGSQDNDVNSDENGEEIQLSGKRNVIKKGLQKINTVLHRNHKKEDPLNNLKDPSSPSPMASAKAADAFKTGSKLMVDDSFSGNTDPRAAKPDSASSVVEETTPDHTKVQMRDKARSMFRQPDPRATKPDGTSSVVEETTPDHNKVQMRDKARNMFRQAGKQARQLKSALSRKGMGSNSIHFRKPIEEETEERRQGDDDSDSTDEDSPSSSLYGSSSVGSAQMNTNAMSCRDQVPVIARDPLAAVSYLARPNLDNDRGRPDDDNAEVVLGKNALHTTRMQETLFHDARW